MATLEEDFKAILTGKMSGPEWRLTAQELSTVRRWAMKTGVAHEFTDGEVRLVDGPVLEAIRQGIEPPGSWYVGLAEAADDDLDEGLDSSPVVSQGHAADGPVVFECVYATQHLITFLGWIFVVRYTPCAVVQPAHLDHDLHQYPSGAPHPLANKVGRQQKMVRRKLPVWGPIDVANSDLWFHGLSPDEAMILTCGADRIFRIVRRATTDDEDFSGFESALNLVGVGEIARIGDVQRRLLEVD